MSTPGPEWIPPYVAQNRVEIHELKGQLEAMHRRLEAVEQWQTWATRLALSTVVTAVIAAALHLSGGRF